MGDRMLVVASPMLEVLSTDGPIPTDGLPERFRCQRCRRLTEWTDGRSVALGDEADEFWCQVCGEEQPLPPTDGPFPFTVAVWWEVATCGACDSTFPWPPSGLPPVCDLHASGRCDPWDEPAGAVVATVEVTGPGHHADECRWEWKRSDGTYETDWCERGIGDGWHTPTGQVSRLNVPVPMERPTAKAEGHFGEIKRPAPWWWADIDLEVPA